ncbi:MAG: hypothetical protein Q9M91_01255 [Candidatus Dojkabacteria bacterium]|nr:hypothetical protein [Candidatus Dojkabacteria bacterium]
MKSQKRKLLSAKKPGRKATERAEKVAAAKEAEATATEEKTEAAE